MESTSDQAEQSAPPTVKESLIHLGKVLEEVQGGLYELCSQLGATSPKVAERKMHGDRGGIALLRHIIDERLCQAEYALETIHRLNDVAATLGVREDPRGMEEVQESLSAGRR